MSAPVALMLERLDGVRRGARGHIARCPAHADKRASLSVAEGRDGRALIRCFAGCETETILTALQMTWGDLFAAPRARQDIRNRPVTASCELDEVRQSLLARERRHAERRARWADVMDLADEARAMDRLIARARTVVDELGDTDEAWMLEARATTLELMMWNAETRAHVAVAGRRLW